MAQQPNLLNAIDVVIDRIDKTATPMSGDVSGRREPANFIARKTRVTIPAQVSFNMANVEFSTLGADEKVSGYFIVRYIDLQNQGITLARGDKIVKIGQRDTQLFLLHSEGDPAAHYSSLGFTLVRMFFTDRNPSAK